MSTDNRTLDEINADDISMLQDALRDRKEHWFTKPDEAMHFIGDRLFKLLARLGVKVKKDMDWRLVDAQLGAHDVRVENRDYEGDDEWRSGIYVYKDDELAGWISKGRRMMRSSLSVYPEYRVQTTIKA